MKATNKSRLRRRHLRVRKKLAGTAERPRVTVKRSLRHHYVVVADDSVEGGAKTLGTFTTATKDNTGKHMANVANGTELGKRVGQELKNRGIETIVFDRGGYRYHGAVKAIADGIRESGIQF